MNNFPSSFTNKGWAENELSVFPTKLKSPHSAQQKNLRNKTLFLKASINY